LSYSDVQRFMPNSSISGINTTIGNKAKVKRRSRTDFNSAY